MTEVSSPTSLSPEPAPAATVSLLPAADSPPTEIPPAAAASTSSASPASPNTSLAALPSPSPAVLLDAPLVPVPPRRPAAPKKGILKPPRTAQKTLFSSFRPRELVGKLLGDVQDAPRPPPTPRERERDRLERERLGGATGQAGAFFSRALGRLSAAASGIEAGAAGALGSGSSSSSLGPANPSSATPGSNATRDVSPGRSTSSINTYSTLLGAPPVGASHPEEAAPLKRASFLLSAISISYPISSSLPPCSAAVLQSIEDIEAEHRKKMAEEGGSAWWTAERLVQLYDRACKVREEKVDARIRAQLNTAASTPSTSPRILDLTNIAFTRFSSEALADVLAVEWGLSKLVLDGCELTEESLKPILHALLVSGTLSTLSLVNNRKLKLAGWRLLSVFLRKARSLRYLDLSDNVFDRKAIDVLMSAFSNQRSLSASSQPQPLARTTTMDSTISAVSTVPSSPGGAEKDSNKIRPIPTPKAAMLADLGGEPALSQLTTLRMDGCGLRGAVLEALAQGVRSSEIKNVSLRRNKIGSLGCVALAIMIKDYPDMVTTTSSPFVQTSSGGGAIMPDSAVVTTTPATYSAYTPRSRRLPLVSKPTEDANLPPIPLLVSSQAGGLTSRTLPEGYKPTPEDSEVESEDEYAPPSERRNGLSRLGAGVGLLGEADLGVGAMMQERVRSLDDVTRIGKLVTLDLKGNDLRSGVSYIAQVLKRNRTLRVCNLADNKIDILGLVALAESLKYNSTLDTLDLSGNPCSGPGLEGISTLRTAFTINANLKRLFLADSGLTTEGAIALAEFLPEAPQLLHLDLTRNENVEVAGIMALAVGLRSNNLLRCLDLTIPFNNGDLAALSQDILQSCIRNTELAQEHSTSKASRAAVWGPIKKSTLAREAKEAVDARALASASASASTPAARARAAVFEMSPEAVITSAEEVVIALDDSLEIQASLGAVLDDVAVLVEKGKALRERLSQIVQDCSDSDRLQVLLGLVDRLTAQIDQAEKVTKVPTVRVRSNTLTSRDGDIRSPPRPTDLSHLTPNSTPSRNSSLGLPSGVTSPSFSIADSDSDDSDDDLPMLKRDSSASASTNAVAPSSSEPASAAEEEPEERVEGTPTENKKSSAWVEEEGEVFRRGVVFNVDDEDEDVSGEDLRKELLEASIDRPAPRQLPVEEEEPVASSSAA